MIFPIIMMSSVNWNLFVYSDVLKLLLNLQDYTITNIGRVNLSTNNPFHLKKFFLFSIIII